MVIDYDKPLDAKGERYETYFLNLVDSRDLLDIVDTADIPTEPEVIYVTPEPTTAPAPTAVPVVQDTLKQENGNGAMLGLVGLMLAAAGGALWYFKLRKSNGGKGKQEYEDDYGLDDDDEEDEEAEEKEDK